MALEENGSGMIMPVAPAYYGGNSGFGGFGDGWWIILLFLVFGGAWGGMGGFGGGDIYPWLNNSQNISDGFRDQYLMTTVSSIGDSINSGFAGVNATINATQMADMQQSFALQSQMSQCCCDNRLATCQTQNIVQAESAATRAAIQDAAQSIKDMMCQDKIDEKNDRIVELQNRLNMADFAASQQAQNNYLQNALTAQTQYFLSLYTPTATAVVG